MSIYEYRPNGENTLPIYPIGTEGLEHAIKKDTALGFVANIARALYPYAKIPAALAIGLLDWDANSLVPTYGKWAGPGMNFFCHFESRFIGMRSLKDKMSPQHV
jgi:hypothetical protein